MLRNYSNASATLLLDDGQGIFLQKDSYMVQDLSYSCHRSIDGEGKVYGETVMSELVLVIRTTDGKGIKPFYRQMQSGQTQSCAIVFDAKFDGNGMLYSLSSQLHFDAFVVGIEDQSTMNDKENLNTTLRFLVCKLEYANDEMDSKKTIFELNN